MSNPRVLNEKEKEEVMNLKYEDITMNLLKSYFAYFGNPAKCRFNLNDRIELKAKEFYNDSDITTTIGRVIVNKFILGEDILSIINFQNYTINKGKYGDLDSTLINLVVNGQITIERLYKYFDDLNWFVYSVSYFTAPSLNTEMYLLSDKVKKKKAELEKKYSNEIANGDVTTFNKNIEEELLAMCKEEIKDYPSYQIFDSGARGSFSNNYKNSVLMRGGITNFTDQTKYDISMSSLVDGIEKDEFDKYANIMTAGTYNRAKNTEVGGYMGKQMQSAFQHIILDEPNSDCGTKKLLDIEIEDQYKSLFTYRYIMEKDKEVLLTPENIKSYVGKRVKMRSPMYCKGDKICNKCAGELYYNMDVRNVGLLCNRTGNTITDLSMKAFHDSSVKINEIDYEKYLSKV